MLQWSVFACNGSQERSFSSEKKPHTQTEATLALTTVTILQERNPQSYWCVTQDDFLNFTTVKFLYHISDRVATRMVTIYSRTHNSLLE